MKARTSLIIAPLMLAMLGASQGEAHAQEARRAGLSVGATYSYMARPTDPQGDPTLLYGSAFAGAGFFAGAYYEHGLSELLGLSAGLYYSSLSGTGYAEDKKNGQKQTLRLQSHTLRLPILGRLRYPLGSVSLVASLGPELLWSLGSGSTATYEGITAPPTPLQTADPLHIGITGAIGVVIPTGKGALPIELRITRDPMVPGSTRERFEDYKSLEQPGRYQVAFDWQFLLSVGAEISL